MITKQEARKIVKVKRAMLNKEILLRESKLIADLIINTEFYRRAAKVFCYASIRGEADTFYLMERVLADGKMLALPVTENRNMEFYQVDSLESLKEGYMGILSPEKKIKLVPAVGDVMIMPGVAFDEKCHRVGYGAGCYDKYLEQYHGFVKIAPAFQFQLFDNLEYDDFDICPDMVVLPDGREYVKNAD